MADEKTERFILLNRIASVSTSRAPIEHKPPLVTGYELFQALMQRKNDGCAIEFFGADDAEKDAEETEEERIKRGTGRNLVWLRDISIDDNEDEQYRHAKLLIEFIDQKRRRFSVVDTKSLKGRDITGNRNERGGVSAHVIVRLPIKQHDSGEYRCAIEVAHSVSRSLIETFINRQLRRWAKSEALKYEVHLPDKKRGGQRTVREYRYNPRLELLADVGRSLSHATAGGRELAHMTFTKRATKQTIGGKDHVLASELVADVELKVNAKQGPDDPIERYKWLSKIRSLYEEDGYQTSLTYRQVNGGLVTGKIHQALAGATDLVMCQKELITLSHEPRDWYSEIDDEVVRQMATFLDKEGLWVRGK